MKIEHPTTDSREINQETIDRLEKFSSLANSDKVAVLLVHEGLKPAMFCDLYFQANTTSYTEDEFLDDQRELQVILDQLGLTYRVFGESLDTEMKSVSFYIARDDTGIDRLLTAVSTTDSTRDTVLGETLGYPPSAIQGFIEHHSFDTSCLEDADKIAAKFTGFKLSESGWKEELELGKRNAETIHKIAPSLYTEISGASL